MPNHRIGIIGIPFDDKSSFLKGSADAPDRIREALNDGSSNFVTESNIELLDQVHFKDLGNVSIESYPESIEMGIRKALNDEERLISLGGDHSVAYPVIQAYSQKYNDLHVLQLDAHTDLYDEYDGDPYSHACPFARIMEKRLVKSLTQVGIRVVSSHQKEQQDRFGVHIITMRDWLKGTLPELHGPLYISLDMDVFDPAYAPGISHYEPGGLTPREVIELILNINVPIVGADLVELNPHRDHHNMTAMLAAKLLKELIGKMSQN